MLVMAEYAYYYSEHSSTKISPVYANYGFKPCATSPTEIQFGNPASEMYRYYITSVHLKLKVWLAESVELMEKNYNKERKTMEPLKKGELVMLNGLYIRAKHRWKKLEDKMLGPFKVVSVGSNHRYYMLELTSS
jgi:hypothetical protein